MITGRASSTWWGAFAAAGIAAGLCGPGVQLAFAALAVALLGLPHGASDLAVIPRARRPSFLVAYIACIGLVIALWRASPDIALGLLLALSALHFGLDDEGDDATFHRFALGAFLIGGPAVLHHATIAGLFYQATANRFVAQDLAHTLQLVGLLATAGLMTSVTASHRLGHRRAGDLVAIVLTVALPPLVGFAIGFVLLHAKGQTLARQREIGCPTLSAYLLRVAPVLAGAVVVLAFAGWELGRGQANDPALLFAGIAALATPHMLVTPLWRRTWMRRRPASSLWQRVAMNAGATRR